MALAQLGILLLLLYATVAITVVTADTGLWLVISHNLHDKVCIIPAAFFCRSGDVVTHKMREDEEKVTAEILRWHECDGMAAGGVRRQVMSEKGRQKKMQKKSGGRIQIFIQFVIVT